MADIKITVDSSELKRATQHTEELRGATSRFEAKLKPLIDKERQFNKAVSQVNDAMRLGVATQKQAIAEVERLGKAYGRTKEQIDRTTASMTGIRKNTNRMNATIQNAGYQFGDFFVQVQSGQNVLVAFSQQGAQLAGLLPGLAGAVTGVGLVVGSMLARALMEGTGLFKGLGEVVEEAGESLDTFLDAQRAVTDGFRKELGPEIVRFSEVILKENLIAATESAQKSIKNILGPMGNLQKTINRLSFGGNKFNETSIDTVKRLKSIKEELQTLSDIDPSNEEDLRRGLNVISKVLEEEIQKELQLSEGTLDNLRNLGEQWLKALKQLVPEAEDTTKELKEQKEFLEEIVRLEKTRDRLAQSLEQKFANSTRKLELMQGGASSSAAGSQISMENLIAQVVAAERAVASQGMNPMQLQKYMGEYEAALLKRLEGYMTEQEAIAELQKIKKDQTDEELLQQRINERLASLESEALMRRSLIGLSQEEANLVKTEYELEKAFGEDRRNFNAQQEAQFQSILELRKQNIAKIQEQKEAEEALKASQKIDEILNTTEKQIAVDTKILSLAEEEAELTQFIYDLEKRLGKTREELSADQQAQYDAIIAAKEAYIQKTLEQKAAEEKLKKEVEAYNKVKQKANDIASVMANETVGALKSIVNGTKTASEAFRDMALNIIQQIMDILIWQPLIQSITNSISGAIMGGMPVPGQRGGGGGFNIGSMIGGLFGGGASLPPVYAKGGAFSAGNVIPFANGGIVGSPTMFGMSGGRTGLMGEAGPEAIMPLKRGPDGKLGVEGGGNVTVNQTFQFAANGDESVKKIIAEAAPKIAKMTEAQIINSRQRGGQMRRAFG